MNCYSSASILLFALMNFLDCLYGHKFNIDNYDKLGFVREHFKPSARPGLAADCYNGARKSDHAERWWANRRIPGFEACPMTTN